MSISQLLEIGRRSIQAYDAAMNVTAQNISNAETEGYKRRRVSLLSDGTASGVIQNGQNNIQVQASGVVVDEYRRVRDRFLEQSKLDGQSRLSASTEDERLLRTVEGLFPIQGESSLTSRLSSFWNGWEELSNYPTDISARQSLRARAQSLTDTLNNVDTSLERTRQDAVQALSENVDSINQTLDRIAELNQTIRENEESGTPALSASDERDQLVTKLSERVPVEIQEEANQYAVTVNGMNVVQGTEVTHLSADTTTQPPTVSFSGTNVEFNPSGEKRGSLGSQLEFLDTTLPNLRQKLDDLANTLVTEVNNTHSTGFLSDGSAAGNFFDPAGTTAGDISLSAAVSSDASNIAASGDSTAAGDNQIALSIADLRNTDLFSGNTKTPGEHTAGIITDVGTLVRNAASQARAEAANVEHVDALENAVSGVSLDEEMTALIEYQQAYAASAKVINTAREISKTLLSL